MKQKIHEIHITNDQFFNISVASDNCHLSWNDVVVIRYINNGQNFLLYDGFVIDVAEESSCFFEQLLSGKLSLHESLLKDLGMLRNYFFCEVMEPEIKNHFVFECFNSHENVQWVGLRYFVWTFSRVNDKKVCFFQKDNKIFFEIFPMYPWFFRDPNPDEVYMPYDEFIKNYKPLVFLEISEDVVLRLYETFKEMQEVLEANDMKYRSENI